MGVYREEIIIVPNYRAREERLGEIWMTTGFWSLVIALFLPDGGLKGLTALIGMGGLGIGFLIWVVGKIKTHLNKP